MLEPIKIYFFGDSICFGQDVSIHKSWVVRISEKLGEFAANYGHEIIVQNPSRNGDTTRQGLERMPYDVQSHEPDVLIVQFGLNDCNYWETDRGNPRVSPGAFEANLEEIIARAFTFGTQYVFLLTNHPTGRDEQPMPHTTNTYEQSNKRYNEIIRKVAASIDHKVILVDIESEFNSHAPDRNQLEKLLLPDKLHINEAGHDLYVDMIFPLIIEACESIMGDESHKKQD